MSKNHCLMILSCLLFFIFNCSYNRALKIDQLFRIYDGNVPGAALKIIQDGKPILTKIYGLADVEKKIPVAAHTNFRLASFTKQFTAMCIMMLQERGKLSYNQTLKEIFPDFPDYGSAITIRHLLHHTSGLIDYESLIPDTATIQVLDKDVLNMMLQQDSTYFPPGAEYRYSNSGYAVLAMIVETVSGQRFADFLKQNIFDPLAMTKTVAYEQGISEVENRAFGYANENGKLVFKDQSLTSAVLGDGGIYSSVDDLFKWDQALYTDKLVRLETLEQAFTPGILNDGAKLDYGFGWRSDEYLGFKRMHHTGQTCGFTTIIQRYPEQKFSIIILINRNEPMLMDLANRLAELFLKK
ncbi:MAG: beta-lactamase family protein [bacterium]|nr:beta-lactamase family protein [bacterium]